MLPKELFRAEGHDLEKHSCDMRHSETYETYRTAKSGYRSGEQRCREKQQAA